MRTMTTAVLTRHGGLEALEVRRDWPVPEPGLDQVLVRVTAAVVNNTDIWTREGSYGLPGRPDAFAGWRGPIAFPGSREASAIVPRVVPITRRRERHAAVRLPAPVGGS